MTLKEQKKEFKIKLNKKIEIEKCVIDTLRKLEKCVKKHYVEGYKYNDITPALKKAKKLYKNIEKLVPLQKEMDKLDLKIQKAECLKWLKNQVKKLQCNKENCDYDECQYHFYLCKIERIENHNISMKELIEIDCDLSLKFAD